MLEAMKRLAPGLLLVVGACATRAPQLLSLTPADSTSPGGGYQVATLAIAAVFVLLVLPRVVPKR